MMGLGLFIEENLQEILSRFHAAVQRELGFEGSALKLAAPILLHDISRAMRSASPPAEPWLRSAMLVLSQPEGGIRGLVREFALLRQTLWETLSSRHHAFLGNERRQVDFYIDEAMANAAERWANMVRLLSPITRIQAKLPSAKVADAQTMPPPPLPKPGIQASPSLRRVPEKS